VSVRIAAAQYPVEALPRFDDYAAKLERWIREAAGAGAQLLLFPEYAAMELAGSFAPVVRADLHAQLDALQALREPFMALHARLARALGVTIAAGSFPVREHGRFHNRVYLFTPAGMAWQDKCMMTRFEHETWGISPGGPLRVFETPAGRLGIATCYDIEFPGIARALVRAGADILLAPSCTDTLAGYQRVRIGSRARALENQCYVVQAPLVGQAPWSPAVDINIGRAGIFTPVDRGFPDDGVLAQGRLDEAGWVYANVQPEHLAAVRRDGQVLNHRDYDRQPVEPRVERLALR
jgi:predicted amidohydrolase